MSTQDQSPPLPPVGSGATAFPSVADVVTEPKFCDECTRTAREFLEGRGLRPLKPAYRPLWQQCLLSSGWSLFGFLCAVLGHGWVR